MSVFWNDLVWSSSEAVDDWFSGIFLLFRIREFCFNIHNVSLGSLWCRLFYRRIIGVPVEETITARSKNVQISNSEFIRESSYGNCMSDMYTYKSVCRHVCAFPSVGDLYVWWLNRIYKKNFFIRSVDSLFMFVTHESFD